MKKLLTFLALMLIALSSNAQCPARGDVNGDGEITITDVTALVDILLHEGRELTVSNDCVRMYLEEIVHIEVTSGSGEYEVECPNPEVVNADIEGSEITLVSMGQGETVVTVRDLVTGKTAEITVTVVVSLTLDVYEITLMEGDLGTVTITSGNGSYEAVSSDIETVDVLVNDSEISLSAISCGEVVVTVTDLVTGETADLHVIVNNCPALQLSEEGLSFDVGETVTVEILSGSGNYEVSSSDENTLEVELDGSTIILYGRSMGQVQVTVTDLDTGQSVILEVMVNPIPDLILSEYEITLLEGEDGTIEVVHGSGEYEVEVSDPNVVEAGTDGSVITLHAVQPGTAQVMVIDENTLNSAFIDVTVYGNLELSAYELTLEDGESGTVDILSGSGSYEVSCSDDQGVEAYLSDSSITIVGHGKSGGIGFGGGTVTVTDTITGQSASIEVYVDPPQPHNEW